MKRPQNFWPLGIILVFLLFISGTISLVVMACVQKVDLVSADYYEQEIKFQNHMEQLDRTQRLGAGAAFTYDAATRRIRVALPTASGAGAITGHIQLYRPSAAGLDRRINLKPDAQGVQFLDAATLQHGLWKVRVSWKVNDQDYFLDQSVMIGAGVAAASKNDSQTGDRSRSDAL
jgi:nitrogen fixation protein FixH